MTTTISPADVLAYYWKMRDKTYTPNGCAKLTMSKFGIDHAELEALLAEAKIDRKRDQDRTRKSRKNEMRKKHGSPIITRDQLMADLDELHDLPRAVRVARVAAYYGLSYTAVNQRVGWNAELSGASASKVYEPTAEEIKAATEAIQAKWSRKERQGRAAWAMRHGVEFRPYSFAE